MLEKHLDGVTAADIAALIDNQVPEGIGLDYKEKLPGNGDDERREFLADVSSFANARGGHLIFGVAEKRDASGKSTGLPDRIVALGDVTFDTEVARLENMIRDGIEPRIPGVQIRGFDCDSGSVVVARIPQSYAAPHLVSFKKSSRFYARNSSGKHQMDVGEIRAAFATSESLPERIRDFRLDRVAKIHAEITPMPLDRGRGLLVLHVVPASAMRPGVRADLRMASSRPAVPIWSSDGHTGRHNFDGYVTFAARAQPSGRTHAYVQVFRNGSIEAVESWLLDGRDESDKGPILRDLVVEPELVKALDGYLGLLRQMQCQPPVFVMLSLLGVRGFRLHLNDWTDRRMMTAIDRDDLMLPELLVESYDEQSDVILRSAFDQIWQAAGLEQSYNYDDQGRWKDRGRGR